ncbi:hypothetical protein [Cellulomonas alba]|uniref:Uncharacterized protein n=1 Tax=Cellulomonas alba TaxID=3053467 RepID=A0ABT7SDF0_9CELL|nr:hypothetical protein [Cellulomonas alba]MDM7853544.1 hypothetical protein [Cellulomonas alba]
MTSSSSLSDQTTATLDSLLGAGLRLSRAMLDALTSSTPASDVASAATRAVKQADIGGTVGDLTSRLASMTAGLTKGASSSCCTIPDACFLPERLPEVKAHGCPGATMRLRLRVTNEWPASRQVAVRATGPDAKAVEIEPQQQAVGPYETATFTATVRLPDDEDDRELSALLWVRGCRDHVVRWRVSSSSGGCACTHEVAVTDEPDTVHHWYDHFYHEPCCRPQAGVRVPIQTHG